MKYIAMVFTSLMLGVLSAGCSHSPTALQNNYGRALETARYHQMVAPGAGAETGPVDGLDGQSAMNVMKAYRDGFEAKKSAATAVTFQLK
jgi:hypothetical protein